MKHASTLKPQKAYITRRTDLDNAMFVQDEAEVIALQRGDAEEAKRRRDAKADLRHRRHLDRPSLRYDPLQEYLSSRRLPSDFEAEDYEPDQFRLWHAVEVLRDAMEADRLGKPFSHRSFVEVDDCLPSLKNPPSPPDPINRWRKAKRAQNADGSPAECPTTFKPKQPKRVPGRPVQWVEIQALRNVFEGQSDHGAQSLWQAALEGFPKPEWKEAFVGVIVFRMSWRKAIEHLGSGAKVKGSTLSANARGDKLMRQAVVGVLERAAQHIESGG